DAPLPNCVFDPSSVTGTDFTIRYSGECLTSNEVKIKVIQTANLRISVPKVTFCIEDAPVTIVASDAGGRFSGRGFADSLSGVYSPSLAGIGKDTIRYELAFEASGDEVCPAAATAIVETFPALMVDFITTDCSGNTVTFDTVNTSNRFSNIRYDFGDGRSATTARASHTLVGQALTMLPSL
ncbi:MAG: hypothetical protein HC892_23585, partial [Saprospiraceae bacterium]|nr:hypothetical protein [Saprospiraceae bacterium]